MNRTPKTIYIRRRTDVQGIYFDIVEKRGPRFESVIYPLAVDYRFLRFIQDKGVTICDADFEVNNCVRCN